MKIYKLYNYIIYIRKLLLLKYIFIKKNNLLELKIFKKYYNIIFIRL